MIGSLPDPFRFLPLSQANGLQHWHIAYIPFNDSETELICLRKALQAMRISGFKLTVPMVCSTSSIRQLPLHYCMVKRLLRVDLYILSYICSYVDIYPMHTM